MSSPSHVLSLLCGIGIGAVALYKPSEPPVEKKPDAQTQLLQAKIRMVGRTDLLVQEIDSIANRLNGAEAKGVYIDQLRGGDNQSAQIETSFRYTHSVRGAVATQKTSSQTTMFGTDSTVTTSTTVVDFNYLFNGKLVTYREEAATCFANKTGHVQQRRHSSLVLGASQ